MTRKRVATVLVVAMLLLAGCSASTTPGTEGGAATQSTAAPGTSAPGGTTGDAGTVRFYISDERNAIGDFAHLNVTVTKVGFQKAGGEETENEQQGEAENETGENTTATSDQTTATPTTRNNTSTATPTNATATATPESENEGTEAEKQDGGEANAGNEGDGKAGWVEHRVESQTVDLTKLQGANATRIGNMSLPEGNYTKVFVYVSEINATLKNGERVRVKLPSQKLHIKKQFTVGNGEQVDFVFDISVFKAGKSGKYILKPIVSQSGTSEDVDIEKVDKQGKPEKEGKQKRKGSEKEAKQKRGDSEGDATLSATFVGNVTPGANATLKVTANGTAVANATVEANDKRVGATDVNGTVTFAVPTDVKKLKVKVKNGDAQVELVKKFEKGDGEKEKNRGNGKGK